MSTKIYDGLRLTEKGLRLWAGVELVPEIRRIIQPVRRRYECDLLVATLLADVELSLVDAMNDISRRVYKAEKASERDPVYGLEFTMVLIPAPGGDVLAQPYAQRDGHRKQLIASGLFEDYSYWDNTDPDEDVSEVDWALRGAAWERAIGPDYIPANHGLTFEYTEPCFYNDFTPWVLETSEEIVHQLALHGKIGAGHTARTLDVISGK